MERPQDHQGQHADIAVIDENVSPRRTVSSRRSPGQGTADLGLFLVTAIMLKIQAQFGRLKTPPTGPQPASMKMARRSREFRI
jgi:hypothetical protein